MQYRAALDACIWAHCLLVTNHQVVIAVLFTPKIFLTARAVS